MTIGTEAVPSRAKFCDVHGGHLYFVLAALRTAHSDIEKGKSAGRGQKVHAEVNCIVYGDVYCFTTQGHIHIGEEVVNSDEYAEPKHFIKAALDPSGPHQNVRMCLRRSALGRAVDSVKALERLQGARISTVFDGLPL